VSEPSNVPLQLDPTDIRFFSGNSNQELADRICEHLGLNLSPAKLERFNDGEINVEIGCNVREKDVFVLQSTCRPDVNHHLMELLIMLDALSRASAARITAVIPYYGYARQDRKTAGRTPISARMVADLITAAGASRVLTVDLHAGQIQGFFNIPVDNLYAAKSMVSALRCCEGINEPSDVVVVSPDAGGVRRALYLLHILFGGDGNNFDIMGNDEKGRQPYFAIVHKHRTKPGEVASMRLIGDVKDKVAILIDDIVDTAGTLISAAGLLKEKGASKVYACCTHPVLSMDKGGNAAHKKIEDSQIDKLIITDTIPLREEERSSAKIEVASISDLLALTVHNIHQGSSVSQLFPFVPGAY
jgi:ribose-phosphate pyrophosphokinase